LVALESSAARRNESGVKWNRYLIKLAYISKDLIQLKFSICEWNCSANKWPMLCQVDGRRWARNERGM